MDQGALNSTLSEWQERVSSYQSVHYLKASRLDKWHYTLGLPTIVLNVVATSVIFMHSGQHPKLAIVAIVPLLAAVLTAVQTFYSHIRRAEKHRAISEQMGRIRRQIDLVKLFPPNQRDAKSVLSALNDEIAKVSANAPTIRLEDVEYYRRAERDVDFPRVLPHP